MANGSKGVATVTDAATGAFTYLPNAGATGADSFTFQASDGSLTSNAATIAVTIAAPNLAVEVQAPNGGERLFVGVPATLRWTAAGATTIDVALSRNGGTTYTAIAACSGLPGTATTCVWSPTGPATDDGAASRHGPWCRGGDGHGRLECGLRRRRRHSDRHGDRPQHRGGLGRRFAPRHHLEPQPRCDVGGAHRAHP